MCFRFAKRNENAVNVCVCTRSAHVRCLVDSAHSEQMFPVSTSCNRRRVKREWNFIERTNRAKRLCAHNVRSIPQRIWDILISEFVNRQSLTHCTTPWDESIKLCLCRQPRRPSCNSRFDAKRCEMPIWSYGIRRNVQAKLNIVFVRYIVFRFSGRFSLLYVCMFTIARTR